MIRVEGNELSDSYNLYLSPVSACHYVTINITGLITISFHRQNLSSLQVLWRICGPAQSIYFNILGFLNKYNIMYIYKNNIVHICEIKQKIKFQYYLNANKTVNAAEIGKRLSMDNVAMQFIFSIINSSQFLHWLSYSCLQFMFHNLLFIVFGQNKAFQLILCCFWFR